MITPKIGIGSTSYFSIYYGYNISTNHSPFSKIGHNQFSFVFSFDKYVFHPGKRPKD
jgi:hypothetical protein